MNIKLFKFIIIYSFFTLSLYFGLNEKDFYMTFIGISFIYILTILSFLNNYKKFTDYLKENLNVEICYVSFLFDLIISLILIWNKDYDILIIMIIKIKSSISIYLKLKNSFKNDKLNILINEK